MSTRTDLDMAEVDRSLSEARFKLVCRHHAMWIEVAVYER